MNVDAFPPVRSMETSGSGCGYTCCEEQILQKEKRQSPGLYGPSSSALVQQLRRAVCSAWPATPLQRQSSTSLRLARPLLLAAARAAAFKK